MLSQCICNTLETYQILSPVLFQQSLYFPLLIHRNFLFTCYNNMLPDIYETIYYLQSSDILEVYSVWQCYESRSAPFYLDLVIFLYLVLLQIVGIILAFQTRKVKINVLNDSKSVAALVYISSIVLIVIVLVTFILRSYINISAAMFSTGIIVLSTVFLLLMFVPKVSGLCIYKCTKSLHTLTLTLVVRKLYTIFIYS